jgi:sorting nexin-7/30/sorting nexin-8
MNWLVNRRYSDFDWLRNILKKFYPRHVIPPLPGKKMGARRLDQDFIEKRMKFLQRFMDEVLSVESFKANEALVSFLKMTDRDQFDRKIKEMNSIICSDYVQDMKTLSGKILVIDDENNEKYYTNINNYFKLQIQIYNRLNYNLKSYYRNINYACRNLEEVQKDFDTLDKLNTKVQMKPEIIKTYEELFIFFKNWGRILSNENEIIKEKIREFFKYQKMENIAYTELIQSREDIKYNYVIAKKKLDDKKTRLYSYMDINKWEIEENYNNIDIALIYRDKNYAWEKMCTRETQALELLHQQIGYANHMNFSQLKRLITKNCKLFVDNTKDFANTFYPSLNDSITLWSTLNTYI